MIETLGRTSHPGAVSLDEPTRRSVSTTANGKVPQILCIVRTRTKYSHGERAEDPLSPICVPLGGWTCILRHFRGD